MASKPKVDESTVRRENPSMRIGSFRCAGRRIDTGGDAARRVDALLLVAI